MGQRFEVPPLAELQTQIADYEAKSGDHSVMLKESKSKLREYLRDINKIIQQDGTEANASTLEIYQWFIAKEKAIYTALNMMKSRGRTLVGFIWAPIEKEQAINDSLSTFPSTEFSKWETGQKIMPPTYFKLNDVTWVPQQIINTYGIPTYKEANPATFTVVTFPFLFGVMFGDYGHGSLLMFMGLLMILFESTLRKSPGMALVLKLRYLLFMGGFFACYNGLLYNEFFAVPNAWFSSCYNIDTYPVSNPAIQSGVPVYLPTN